MAPDDVARAVARHAREAHEVPIRVTEGDGPHHACVPGPLGHHAGQHHVLQPRPQHAHDGQHHDLAGEGEHHIAQTHKTGLHPSAHKARQHAQQGPQRDRGPHGQQRDAQRGPGPVEQTGKDVAPQPVRAQPVLGPTGGQLAAAVHGQRIPGRQPRGQQGRQQYDAQEQQTGQARPVMQQCPYAPHRSPRSRRRGSSRDAQMSMHKLPATNSTAISRT